MIHYNRIVPITSGDDGPAQVEVKSFLIIIFSYLFYDISVLYIHVTKF